MTGKSARFNRARVTTPFPVHRWEEHVPDAVVLPTTAEQVSEVVDFKPLARIPVVPRAGATGLTDGAVPLRHGLVVDVKLMNRIHELDLVDRTVTVGPGINMLKLNEELQKHGVIYPDDPASYPCSLVGGRRDQRLVFDRRALRAHPRPRHQLPDRASHRRDHRGRGRWRAQASQVLQRLPAEASVHGSPSAGSSPRRRWSWYLAEAEFSAFFAYEDYESAWRSTGALARSGLATLAGVVLFDEWKLAYLRRDDEAYIPQPESVKAVVAVAMYGTSDEVKPGAKRSTGSARTRTANTSVTRSRKVTGPRATTAMRLRCTGAFPPVRWRR